MARSLGLQRWGVGSGKEHAGVRPHPNEALVVPFSSSRKPVLLLLGPNECRYRLPCVPALGLSNSPGDTDGPTAMHPTHPPQRRGELPVVSGPLSMRGDSLCRPITRDDSTEYPGRVAGNGSRTAYRLHAGDACAWSPTCRPSVRLA